MAVPSWKQAILDKRRKQEAEEERRKKDEEAKLSAIPAWKRSIMQRKDESKARSSATKALFGPKPSSIKPQEKTPSDSKAIAKSSTETTIAKSTEEKRKVETTSQCKWSDKGKTPNGSAVVEKNFKPHAATPSREKMALRRTASSDAAASNSPSPHKTRRWPVVAPPTTLVRCSSSPRNTKREVAQEMGVPEANDPSEDSPTLNQRKETFHDQVVKTSPTVAKQQKMNPTSPLLEEKPFPAANTQTSKESVKRGSVKSLMGLFQGDRKTGNKTTVNSTARKMAIQRGEHSSEESKLISKISMASVSQVLENTAAASSPAQKAKAHLAVSVESKLPVSTSSVVSKTEHSVTSNVIPTMEFKASQEFELALRQSVSDQKEVVLEERPTEKPSMSFMMYHTKVATRSEAVTTTTTTAIQHQNRNDQFENKYASSKDDVLLSAVSSVDRSSNDTKTQWETEEDELTVTSIDDVINISDEEEQHQKMKETKSENTSRLASTSMTTEPAQSTATNLTSDISTLFEDNVVHERRSSATLTPQKQADVSGVIGDAQASSALNSATSSAQNSDSESTTSEPRRKSSLVDRSKPRRQRRRVSFNEVQLEVEHYYPKPIYEEEIEAISSPARLMVTDIDETDDSTVIAVKEERHREQKTGLALPPHPILQPQQASPSTGSPSSYQFGASFHSYQPQLSSYSHLQGTLEKKKKKSKDKKNKKEEPKAPPESPIDYSKLNEETAAMLW